MTCEEVLWDSLGRLLTHGPSTYKIPAIGDIPTADNFRIKLLSDAAQRSVVHGSKAVGEPPFMLALGVVSALRQAIASWGPPAQEVELSLPATPEAILRAIVTSRENKSNPKVPVTASS